MSLIWTKQWLPIVGNEDVIAPVQALAAAGNLQLNTSTLINQNAIPFTQSGSVSNFPYGGPYLFDGFARSLNISSTSNLSARTVTITGIGATVYDAGNTANQWSPSDGFSLISEDITGPNNGTASSVNIYQQILSITIDGAALNISVGLGDFGISTYFTMDQDRIMYQASASGELTLAAGALTYSLFGNLRRPEYPGTQGNLIESIQPLQAFQVGMYEAVTDDLSQLSGPLSLAWFSILSTADATGIFTIVQQGIR